MKYIDQIHKMERKCVNVPTLMTETCRHRHGLGFECYGGTHFRVRICVAKSTHHVPEVLPVVGQNHLARRVFGWWRRGGSMMEATLGLPCLNLKTSENCHRCCTTCASSLFDLLRAHCAKQRRDSARRVAARRTHMRFPISHENGEQGNALNYACCGFPLATPLIKNHFDHNLVSRFNDSGAPRRL